MAVNLQIADVGQFPASSNEACGLACLLAILRWLKIDGILTLNQLIAETPLAQGAKGLTPSQVATIGVAHGLDCRVEKATSIELMEHAAAGRPSICLMNYGDIPRNIVQDKPFTGEHFEVFEGYSDANEALMDDPDRTQIGSAFGTGIHLPMAILDKALKDSALPNQVVVVYGVLQLRPDHGDMTNSPGGLHLRLSPNGVVLTTIPDKSPLWILPDREIGPLGGHIWVRVTFDDGNNFWHGWVAKDFLLGSPVPLPTPVPPTSTTMTVNTPILHTRISPNIAAPRGKDLTKEEVIQVLPFDLKNKQITGGLSYSWVQIAPDDKSGDGSLWCDMDYLVAGDVSPSPVPPVVKPTGGGYGPHGLEVGSIPNASYPIYKSVDNINFLALAHIKNPDAMLIFRIYQYHERSPDTYINESGGVDKAVTRWLQDLTPKLVALPHGTYVESFNEKGHSNLYFEFEALRAKRLMQLGLYACCGNMAVASYTGSELWPRVKLQIQQIVAAKGVLGIHCYAQTMMSANYSQSYWDESGNWHGELFPTNYDPANAWTACRVMEDRVILHTLGIDAEIVATELGLDDVGGGGIHYPASGKTRGWHECVPVWQAHGWLDGTTAPEFYMKQLAWWCQITGMMGCVYTYSTAGDKNWDSFNVQDVF